jgi:hypothetical protein
MSRELQAALQRSSDLRIGSLSPADITAAVELGCATIATMAGTGAVGAGVLSETLDTADLIPGVTKAWG